jgi:hypothetical protein
MLTSGPSGSTPPDAPAGWTPSTTSCRRMPLLVCDAAGYLLFAPEAAALLAA